jgi:hypothetical protein
MLKIGDTDLIQERLGMESSNPAAMNFFAANKVVKVADRIAEPGERSRWKTGSNSAHGRQISGESRKSAIRQTAMISLLTVS